eukprot:TRINITY_DN40586_c0_g1_i1.p1 TRINITY_DN40586_c0_g1~~TRINITY_DN40586_c0_g1_i1.p1  ORF type:complete len:540 (-),score=96.73 TRINITY_DN40586_c0_g1_i1:11-1567(-)
MAFQRAQVSACPVVATACSSAGSCSAPSQVRPLRAVPLGESALPTGLPGAPVAVACSAMLAALLSSGSKVATNARSVNGRRQAQLPRSALTSMPAASFGSSSSSSSSGLCAGGRRTKVSACAAASDPSAAASDDFCSSSRKAAARSVDQVAPRRQSPLEAAAASPARAPDWLLEQLRAADTTAQGRLGEWSAGYVNLARRGDRRQRMREVLAPANAALLSKLKRIDAVDGRELNLHADAPRLRRFITEASLTVARDAKDSKAYTIVHQDGKLVKFHNHLTTGGVACAMSHYKALEAVANHPTAEWGLILEDDISAVVPCVHEEIARILARLPSNWESLFLGYHGGVMTGQEYDMVIDENTGQQVLAQEAVNEEQRATMELQIDEMRGFVDGFQGSKDPEVGEDGLLTTPVLRMYMALFGLYAYVVRRDVAREALQGAFPVHGQVDNALSQWLVSRGNSFRVAPKHMLFYSPKSEDRLDSDIQTMAKLEDLVGNEEDCERYLNFINRTTPQGDGSQGGL